MNVELDQLNAVLNQARNQATVAAKNVLREYYNGEDGGCCGFAWVTVFGVRVNSKVGKLLAAEGFDKAYGGGLQLWDPSDLNVQNIDAKEAGARVYAEALRNIGLRAYAGSRMD